MNLPEIGHVDVMHGVQRFDRRFARADRCFAFGALLAHDLRDVLRIDLADDALDRARVVVAHVRGGAAHGAEHAGIRRHQHRADADLLHQRGAVHRASAAERHEREIARIVPALDR